MVPRRKAPAPCPTTTLSRVYYASILSWDFRSNRCRHRRSSACDGASECLASPCSSDEQSTSMTVRAKRSRHEGLLPDAVYSTSRTRYKQVHPRYFVAIRWCSASGSWHIASQYDEPLVEPRGRTLRSNARGEQSNSLVCEQHFRERCSLTTPLLPTTRCQCDLCEFVRGCVPWPFDETKVVEIGSWCYWYHCCCWSSYSGTVRNVYPDSRAPVKIRIWTSSFAATMAPQRLAGRSNWDAWDDGGCRDLSATKRSANSRDQPLASRFPSLTRESALRPPIISVNTDFDAREKDRSLPNVGSMAVSAGWIR